MFKQIKKQIREKLAGRQFVFPVTNEEINSLCKDVIDLINRGLEKDYLMEQLDLFLVSQEIQVFNSATG